MLCCYLYSEAIVWSFVSAVFALWGLIWSPMFWILLIAYIFSIYIFPISRYVNKQKYTKVFKIQQSEGNVKKQANLGFI